MEILLAGLVGLGLGVILLVLFIIIFESLCG